MSGLEDAFGDGPAFIPYLVAGDPTPDASARYVKTLEAAGADAIELGLPFSEPIAEGETIQRGINRALEAGMTTDRYFELVRSLDVEVPIVCMTYYNLLFRYGSATGPEPFVRAADAAGVDGLIVPDLPVEESDPLWHACETHDVELISIVAPTTTDERLECIRRRCSGFVYVQARLGTTGERTDRSSITSRSIDRVAAWSVPAAVGFGIASGQQARSVIEAGADGVIVGSALVETIEEGHRMGDAPATVAARLNQQAAAIASGVHGEEELAPAVESILSSARSRTPPETTVSVTARSIHAALADAAAAGRVPIIAEVKRTSPSQDRTHAVDPVAVAKQMVDGGAAAISVLTESTHFGGSPAALERIRAAVDVPVLRKDFILNEAELDRVEADAVLLIARFIDDLPGLVSAARSRGMTPLVEVHTSEELERALAADATLIGINNRDLGTLTVDLDRSERLLAEPTGDATIIAESGITTCSDVQRMVEAGADGLLIGTALMAGDPTATVERFVDCVAPPTEEVTGR